MARSTTGGGPHGGGPSGHPPDADPLRARRTIERVRWGATAFIVLQFLLFAPSARAGSPPLAPLVGGALFAAALAAVNGLSHLSRLGRPSPARLRAGGLLATGADILVLIAAISYYSFDPEVRLWPMLVFPLLEGAIVAGFAGAVAAWGFASLGYAVQQFVDGPGQGYSTAEIVPAVTFASAVLATVAVTTGALARSVTREQAVSAAQRDQLAALVAVGRELAAEHSPTVVLERFVAAACDLTGYDRALLLGEGDDGWTLRATAPGTAAPVPGSDGRDRIAGLAATIVGAEATDAAEQPVVSDLLPGCRSYGIAPVRMDGDTVALLVLGTSGRTPLGPEDLAAIELLTGHAAVALENAELARAREHTIAELEAIDRVKNDFVSILTHELRSPMTTVAGFADIFVRRYDDMDDERRRHIAGRIASGVHRQSQLIGDVADALLAERTALPIDVESVDVAALVTEAVGSTHLVTGGDRIVVVADPGVPHALCDPIRLTQIVDNLLTNALKYSPLDSPVEVLVTSGQRLVAVEVADRGLGIPPERRDGLFQKFSRLHPDSGVGGTGLGLYLCAQLVEAMGGTIEAVDRPGGGTTFRVELPAVPSNPMDALGEASAGGSAEAQVDHVP